MITTTSEYALRALADMARRPRGSSTLGRDLARRTGVPANYLSKILLELRRAGLVEAARGAGGGYRLRRKPSEIFLIDVVRVFDGPRPAQPACLLFHEKECKDRGHCSAHSRWRELGRAYNGFLLVTTVAEIAGTDARPRTAASA